MSVLFRIKVYFTLNDLVNWNCNSDLSTTMLHQKLHPNSNSTANVLHQFSLLA